MSRPVALIVRAPGTNRDHDVALALDLAGAEPQIATAAEIIAQPELVGRARIVVVAGGFSYADALGAGRLLGHELASALGDELRTHIAHGRPVIGICNGFQALVRAGLLSGGELCGALGDNESGYFACRWVRLAPVSQRCVWTAGLTEQIDCPIAHGEGRFACDDDTLALLERDDRIALRYAPAASVTAESGDRGSGDGGSSDGGSGYNPNGSRADIAGICDDTGLVLGLMPHPENHVLPRQHPLYGRRDGRHGAGLGLRLFEQGVRHAKEL